VGVCRTAGRGRASASDASSSLTINRIHFMDAGRIVERGSGDEFFNNPKSQRTKDFLGKILRFEMLTHYVYAPLSYLGPPCPWAGSKALAGC
jgi:hypothetical protein